MSFFATGCFAVDFIAEDPALIPVPADLPLLSMQIHRFPTSRAPAASSWLGATLIFQGTAEVQIGL
jgi:hypothetical protein